MNTDIQQIHDCESSLDSNAHELISHLSSETKAKWYAFSEAMHEDLRKKFGDVFENFPSPLRDLVIEHKITAKNGEKFPPIVIPAEQFGSDFKQYKGETHIHSDGMRKDVPVSFYQTFLTTSKTDEELIRDFSHA
jgi:hypothetical protein